MLPGELKYGDIFTDTGIGTASETAATISRCRLATTLPVVATSPGTK